MGAFDTFAKRKRAKAKAGQPDVYQYDEIPPLLRKQIGLILPASLGSWHYGDRPCGNENWEALTSILEKEFLDFPNWHGATAMDRCLKLIREPTDTDEWLSLVELCCRLLMQIREQGHHSAQYHYGAEQPAEDALQEINDRFRENGFGYQYESGDIIRVDDQFVHSEIVKPTLQLLSEKSFEKANEEFMTAHRHYRSSEFKDAIVAANRAFEATLKAICNSRAWKYEKGARASELITTVRKNGLFPEYLDDGLNTYIAMMKTGLPRIRNNAGGHGEAPDTPEVPSYMASYAIHLTAANILLAIDAHKKKH